MVEAPSRVASAAAYLGILGAAACAIGPGAVQVGVVAPVVGFGIFAFGLLCGLLAVFTGLGGVWTTRASVARSGRSRALAGIGIGLVLIGVAGFARKDSDNRATFNDITTDLSDPPAFRHALDLPPNRGRDMGYPAAFAPQQREVYPDLAPIAVAASPSDAMKRAEATAESLGWEITEADGAGGVIEATQTSGVFRFVDDIVIRVRPGAAGGSTIDVRSKSRDGVGDMGVNAARIRAFRDAIAG